MATLLKELRNLPTALKSLAGGGIRFPNVLGHGKADGTHVTTAPITLLGSSRDE